MSRGKARGVNREYQLQCRDVLVFREPGLSPYSGDGIDVPFEFGGTTWSMDVALRKATGELVVAECRRYGPRTPIKQEALAAFAHKVERLRESVSVPVAGVFVARMPPQVGAIKHAQYEGIDLVVLAEGSAPPGFAMSFLRYDPARNKRRQDAEVHVPPATLELHDSVNFELIRRKIGG